jgi:hypothetical protein
MKYLAGAALVTAMLGFSTHPTLAQTRLDHDVQKMWDDTFNPGPRGDPRTNWERRNDADRYAYERERRREGERAEWCRYHPGACGGGPGYGSYYGR